MEPEIGLNIREEIVQVLARLAEIFQQLYQGNDGENQLLPIFLQRNGQRRSILRYVGNNLPSAVVFDTWCYYRRVLDYITYRKSFLREIASRLPLQASKRPYFYMFHLNRMNEGMKSRRFIHSTPCRNTIDPGSASSSAIWDTMNDSCSENTHYMLSTAASNEAVQKITALEDELSRLRAQIAGFVLKQDDGNNTSKVSPPMPPLPPPPPPPPLPTTGRPKKEHLISKKENTKKELCSVNQGERAVVDMTLVLKDLNQVKLKAIERSPGGTPFRRAPLKAKANDPASIIADALKHKFAKSRIVSSPDKENQNSNSPGNSFNNTPSPQLFPRNTFRNETREVNSPLAEMHSIPLRV